MATSHPEHEHDMPKSTTARSEGRAIGQVLVVEDDALLALDIEQALLDAGAAGVRLCPSTSEALILLRENRFDAIVLDVHLADRSDGWAIAELVDSIGPRPPRIVFSTGAPQDIPSEIAELGTVLAKPYHPRDLIRAVAAPARKGLMSRLRALRA